MPCSGVGNSGLERGRRWLTGCSAYGSDGFSRTHKHRDQVGPAGTGLGKCSSSYYGQTSGICADAATNFVRLTPEGIKAIPPGLPIPVTIGVTNPVDRLVCPTNDSIGFGAVGDENTLTAEYALAAK